MVDRPAGSGGQRGSHRSCGAWIEIFCIENNYQKCTRRIAHAVRGLKCRVYQDFKYLGTVASLMRCVD